MDRDRLSRMSLDELRRHAAASGVAGAAALTRAELLEALAPAGAEGAARARGFLDRTRAATERAAGRRSAVEAPAADAPVAEEIVTETVARLYEAQGQPGRAVEVYRQLAQREPDNPRWTERLAELAAAAQPPALRAPTVPLPPGAIKPAPSSAPAPRRDLAPEAPPPPQEPWRLLDLEDPPEEYGVDTVCVLPRDPFALFCYWELTDDGLAAARAALGPEDATRVLRVVLHLPGAGTESRDYPIDWNHGRRYVETRPGLRASAAVGLLGVSGRFVPIAHAGIAAVAPDAPGPEGPVEWMEVEAPRPKPAPPPRAEPIVIVTRGPSRVEPRPAPGAARRAGAAGAGPEGGARALPPPARWEGGAWHHPGSRVPPPPPRAPGAPAPTVPTSPWRWRPGAP